MVSFIDFYIHLLANYQTKASPYMSSKFTHVMKPARDTHSEPGYEYLCFYATEQIDNVAMNARVILNSNKFGESRSI